MAQIAAALGIRFNQDDDVAFEGLRFGFGLAHTNVIHEKGPETPGS
jgi:hypothetical protein